jgi:hypothetical protein
MEQFIAQPEDEFRLGDFLTHALKSPDWTCFRAAIAFVKRSGTKHVKDVLADFSKRAAVIISTGIDSGGTSAEGLQDLIDAVSPSGKLWVFHNANASTFHPKIYLFKNAGAAEILIGSGNLTEGGLYTNYEAGVRLALSLEIPSDRSILADVEKVLDKWSAPTSGICYALDAVLLKKLIASGKVPSEAKASGIEESSSVALDEGPTRDSLFKAVGVRPAPKAPPGAKPKVTRASVAKGAITGASTAAMPSPAPVTGSPTFVMTLQKTDAGYGQIHAGTARRSPEIFVPIRAVDANPAFWGWPHLFEIDKAWSKTHAKWIKSKKGTPRSSSRPLRKMDRTGVVIQIVNNGSLVSAVMWYNPDKVDLRIRHEQLRSAGKVGDVMILSTASPGAAYDYQFEVVAPADPRFKSLSKACGKKVAANSKKRYGYI